MTYPICIFHKVIYCWDDVAPTLLVPCGQNYPSNVVLPVCTCDQGRLTGPSQCSCSFNDSKCESQCLNAGGGACGTPQAKFGEISDYLKVLLGLVTFVIVVSFYVAVKRYMRRRNRRNRTSDLPTGERDNGAVRTISGNPIYHHRHYAIYGYHSNRDSAATVRAPPPTYEEVNSIPPPYELAIKVNTGQRLANGKTVTMATGVTCRNGEQSDVKDVNNG